MLTWLFHIFPIDFSSTSLGEDELRLAVWIHHVTGDAQSGAAAAPWSDWQDETNGKHRKNDGNYGKYGKSTISMVN